MTASISMKPARACLGLLALACATSACDLGIPGDYEVRSGGPPADAAGTVDAAVAVHAVRGTAVGVLAALDLRLQHDGGSEIVRVDRDGPFAFETRLARGAAYTVVPMDEPACVVASGEGVVDAADVEVELVCEAVLLTALGVSGTAALVPAFAQAQREYEVHVSLLQQSVRVTAVAASAEASIEIEGVATASGAPSESLPLALGENVVAIRVHHPSGAERTYRVTVRREAAIAERFRDKASHPGPGEQLGYSVALWGDILAVGARHEGSATRGVREADHAADDAADNSGAVYVFRRAGSAWVQEAFIKASNAAAYAEFGYSVALWGDTLAVGARGEGNDASGIVHGDQPSEDSGLLRESGAVYVYRRGADGGWSQEAYIKASNAGARDEFGERVALREDTLVVGVPQEDSSATGVDGPQDDELAPDSGAVYVYRREQGTWHQEAYLKPARTHAWDKFGVDVALGPDVLAVGAFYEDGGSTGVGGDPDQMGAPDSGAAYVFRRVGVAWAQEAYLKASNTGAGDEFGQRLAIDGDTLVVGAPRENASAAGNDEAACDSGAVYVFVHRDGAWAQPAYLKAPGADVRDGFGRALALAGDTLVVGAHDGDRDSDGETCTGGIDEGGALHVFQRAGDAWMHAARIQADDRAAGDYFGWSVALHDGTLAAGAPRQDDGAGDSGAIYLFH